MRTSSSRATERSIVVPPGPSAGARSGPLNGPAAILAALLATTTGCQLVAEAPDARLPVDFDAIPHLPDADLRPDAEPPVIDANTTPDAFVPLADAAPVAGTIVVADSTHQGFGHGLVITPTWLPLDARPPDVDTRVGGGPPGCFGFVFDIAAGDFPTPPRNEGTVRVTGASVPIPDCVYVDEQIGYRCSAFAGMGSIGDSIVANGDMTATFFDEAPGYTFTADDVGRWIEIASPSLNAGRYPIVAVDPVANSATFYHTSAVAESVVLAEYEIYAAGGSIPGTSVPDPLGNNDLVTVELIPGGLGEVPAFTSAPINTADEITLTPESEALLANIPTDGSEIALACQNCGDGFITSILIQSTDAPIPAGAPPDFMPAPIAKRLQLQCILFGTSPADTRVPPEVSALIAQANPTRIRAAFFVANLGQAGEFAKNQTNIVVGHSIVDYTTY